MTSAPIEVSAASTNSLLLVFISKVRKPPAIGGYLRQGSRTPHQTRRGQQAPD